MEIKEAMVKRDALLKRSQDLDVKRQAVRKDMQGVQKELDPLIAQIQQHRKDHPAPGTQKVGGDKNGEIQK